MDITIDLEQLDMIADGYTEDFVEIYREFCVEIPVLFQELDTAISTNQADAVARLAHTIKGSISNFGMRSVTDGIQKIEFLAKDGNLSDLPQLLQKAREDFDKSLESIKTQRNI